MKVLHIINNLGRGGAEKLLVNILPVYKELGIEVAVLQISDRNSEPSYLKSLNDQGIKSYSLGQESLYSPVYIFRLRNFLNDGEYDIVHTHLFPALYWTAISGKFLKRRPVLIFTEHNTQNKRSGKIYLRAMERWVYARFDKIVAISDKVKLFLEGRVCPSGQIAVINNGVNIDVFSRAEIYPESFWKDVFNLPEKAVKLMMTARLNYPKDHFTLISALRYLPENYFLLIAGDGPDKASIQKFAFEQSLGDRVIFTGFRTDIPSLMKSVDINVLSSAYEGMSGVALEALASAKPFLGSDVPGINDIVPSEQMLFEHQNAPQLAEKILKIVTSDKQAYNNLIATGQKHAAANSLQEMAKNHLILYKQLLQAEQAS